MIICFLIIIGAQLLIMIFIFLIEQFLLDNIFVEIKIHFFQDSLMYRKFNNLSLLKKVLISLKKLNKKCIN